jgi:Mce-associated membrane protein
VNVVALHDTDASPEVADEVRGEPAPPSGRGRWRRIVAAAVLLALVAAVAVAVAQWRRADDLAAEADARRAVATTAGDFAAALLSYDAAALDEARDRVTELATPSFAAEYTAAFDNGLRPVIDELDAVATATVRDVLVSDVSGSTARAVVVADSSVTSAAGERDLEGSYLQLELERVDGRWRVAAATAVGARTEDLTATTATTTATTTPGG